MVDFLTRLVERISADSIGQLPARTVGVWPNLPTIYDSGNYAPDNYAPDNYALDRYAPDNYALDKEDAVFQSSNPQPLPLPMELPSLLSPPEPNISYVNDLPLESPRTPTIRTEAVTEAQKETATIEQLQQPTSPTLSSLSTASPRPAPRTEPDSNTSQAIEKTDLSATVQKDAETITHRLPPAVADKPSGQRPTIDSTHTLAAESAAEEISNPPSIAATEPAQIKSAIAPTIAPVAAPATPPFRQRLPTLFPMTPPVVSESFQTTLEIPLAVTPQPPRETDINISVNQISPTEGKERDIPVAIPKAIPAASTRPDSLSNPSLDTVQAVPAPIAAKLILPVPPVSPDTAKAIPRPHNAFDSEPSTTRDSAPGRMDLSVPIVEVTIGHISVKATPAVPAAKTRPKARRPKAGLSLEQYLNQRDKR